jgi:hypothetical protein
VESDISTLVDGYLREQADRPLGDVQLVSGRAVQQFSRPLHVGADNLLLKALRALEQGDRERARGYIARAARIPFDEFEEEHPGLLSAHMTLFAAVTDALEECAPGDAGWLDAALRVLGSCGEDARLDLLRVLDEAQQAWQLEGRERRRVRAAVAGVDAEGQLRARLEAGRTSADQVILEVLDAVLAYEEALAG